MSVLGPMAAVVIAVLALSLLVALVRFNHKRLQIARCAASASPEQLEAIYSLVDGLGTVPSKGYVLARTNQHIKERRCLVSIPTNLAGFPWGGRVIEVLAGAEADVQFRFVETTLAVTSLLGQLYRPVRVPRHRTRESIKNRNLFAPGRYVRNSADLQSALVRLCPKYPSELLSYLMCVGSDSFEFEPIDQARIATSPAWVQDPEYPSCPECGGRMRLILQLPGTVISEKPFHRGTFYLFGCSVHPDRTKSLQQFT